MLTLAAMQLLDAPLDQLMDAPRNANQLDPKKFDELVGSIRRIGFVQHILVRRVEGFGLEIVDGHHRARAMRHLGESTIPSILLESDEDPRLVALALNRLRGQTNLAAASLIIGELLDAGLTESELSISGFTEREMRELVDALDSPDDPSLDDVAGAEVPEPIGAEPVRPFLLELTFRTKEELAAARRALRKAAGKGNDLADGLMRMVRGE